MASIGDQYGFSATPTATNPYPDNTGGTGVVPLTVEPLNGIQQNAIMGLSGGLNGGGSISQANDMLKSMLQDPQSFAAKYTNPAATGFLNQASSSLAGANAPITQQEIEDTANPFAGALKNRLTQQGEIARAQLLQGQGQRGARSFGDTATGVRQGMLDQEELSKSNDIDYSTFNDARTMLENMRNRSLSAAGAAGGLATGAQGITNSALTTGANGANSTLTAGLNVNDATTSNFKNQLGAGTFLQGFNQNVANKAGADMMAQAGDPAAKLQQAMDLLKNYQSKTSGSTPGANGTDTAGNLLGIGASILGSFL